MTRFLSLVHNSAMYTGAMGERHTIHAVLDKIERSQRFLVSAHARPDGDAVGSMLACAMILEQLGKQVDMVSCDRVPLIYRSLPCSSLIRQVSRVDGEYDAVILLECDGIERSRLRGLEGAFPDQYRPSYERTDLCESELDQYGCLRSGGDGL